MKTVQEYLNDPRILNDPCMEGALEPVKELHAIRLKMQDEAGGMGADGEAAYWRRLADGLFIGLGLPLPQYAGFPGQGKLKPREPVLA
jgi:hypothetical protein